MRKIESAWFSEFEELNKWLQGDDIKKRLFGDPPCEEDVISVQADEHSEWGISIFYWK